MLSRTLGLAAFASSLALATAAFAGPGGHGGLGGGLGGGLSGGIGGGLAGHMGGIGGGMAGHAGGEIGGALGAPAGGVGGGLTGSLAGSGRMNSPASASGQAHANEHSVLGGTSDDASVGAALDADETVDDDATNDGRVRRDAARAKRAAPAHAAEQGISHSNVNAGLRDTTSGAVSATSRATPPARVSGVGVTHSDLNAGLRSTTSSTAGASHHLKATKASTHNTADNHGRTRRETARAKRMGPTHASAKGTAHANANAGLSGSSGG